MLGLLQLDRQQVRRPAAAALPGADARRSGPRTTSACATRRAGAPRRDEPGSPGALLRRVPLHPGVAAKLTRATKGPSLAGQDRCRPSRVRAAARQERALGRHDEPGRDHEVALRQGGRPLDHHPLPSARRSWSAGRSRTPSTSRTGASRCTGPPGRSWCVREVEFGDEIKPYKAFVEDINDGARGGGTSDRPPGLAVGRVLHGQLPDVLAAQRERGRGRAPGRDARRLRGPARPEDHAEAPRASTPGATTRTNAWTGSSRWSSSRESMAKHVQPAGGLRARLPARLRPVHLAVGQLPQRRKTAARRLLPRACRPQTDGPRGPVRRLPARDAATVLGAGPCCTRRTGSHSSPSSTRRTAEPLPLPLSTTCGGSGRLRRAPGSLGPAPTGRRRATDCGGSRARPTGPAAAAAQPRGVPCAGAGCAARSGRSANSTRPASWRYRAGPAAPSGRSWQASRTCRPCGTTSRSTCRRIAWSRRSAYGCPELLGPARADLRLPGRAAPTDRRLAPLARRPADRAVGEPPAEQHPAFAPAVPRGLGRLAMAPDPGRRRRLGLGGRSTSARRWSRCGPTWPDRGSPTSRSPSMSTS